jgi:hypothetical protein
MTASTRCLLLLAAALAAALAVGGCGGTGNGGTPPAPQTVDAFLTDASGLNVVTTADQGEQVYVQAQVPDGTTSTLATIVVPEGAPAPAEGTTLQLLAGTWTSPANRGRAFTVPSGATVGITYYVQVTAHTSSGDLSSELLALTVTGGVPPSVIPAWFDGHILERDITAAKGASITVLARDAFGTATAVQANIQGSPAGTPAPPQGSVIPLNAGSWPDLATHGGSFTVPTNANSGAVYTVVVVATYPSSQGVSPTLTVTVQ